MKFQYKFNEVIKNPYITIVLLTSHQYFSFVSLSSLSILLLLPMTFPLWWYILIRTLKKTDGHHVFRKAAEAVYREIIDNHWLRTMAASSKDGLSTLGKHMSPLSIQSHWLLLPHPTTTNLGKYWIHLIKYKGFYQHMLQAPWSTILTKTDLYLVSHTNPYVTSAIFKNYRHRRGPFTQ